jgi:hypothetical protein
MTAVFAGHVLLDCSCKPCPQRSSACLKPYFGAAGSPIITTDEVLTEYLTFFATAPEPFRLAAAEGVERILANSIIRVIPQSRDSSLTGLRLLP